jgi:hypothetical protein
MENSAMTRSRYLSDPGEYHVTVTSYDDSPRSQSGTWINGVRMTLKVLTESHEGHLASLILFTPRVDVVYAPERLRADELIRAAGLDHVLAAFPPASGAVHDWNSLMMNVSQLIEGAQFVVDFERPGKYLQAARFRHVDDPSVSRYVLNSHALRQMLDGCRRSPYSFQESGDDVDYEPASADDCFPDPADFELYIDEPDDDVEYGP